MIRSAVAARLLRIGHAHSERADGAVGNSRVPGRAEARARLARAAGAEPEALVVPDQVHGTTVLVVDGGARGAQVGAADGLATATPGVALLVQGADCPLALVADDDAGAVAVVHSGWRGTVARIGASGVAALRTLGARPERMVAAVFPGIGRCCFEVGPEVVSAFREAFGPDADRWMSPGREGTDRWMADLAPAIARTFADEGVRTERIDVVRGCTSCGGNLFSHRRSGGAPERHGLVAVVKAAT